MISTPGPEKSPIPTTGHEHFIAPDGTRSGDGTLSHPWDLKSALSGRVNVQPGDILYLRSGKYSSADTILYARLSGSPGQYITVRPYPGERVTIDGQISVTGSYIIFQELEMINTNPDRTKPTRLQSFSVWSSHIKIINNIVHDSGGLGIWWQGEDVEVYGNLIYDNGWLGSDRGHGHGIYTTNLNGTKLYADNIVFNNFSGINFHAYSEKTYLQGFTFTGNISFNGKFLVGGSVPASRVALVSNYFFRSPAILGYDDGVTNQDLTLLDNFFEAENNISLDIRWWTKIKAIGNTIWNQGGSLASIRYPQTPGSYEWDTNTGFTTTDTPFLLNGALKTWNEWKVGTGYDQNSSISLGKPTENAIFVRPNRYEAKRGNVIVYNWDQRSSVSVDISALGLAPGDTYVLHNAQNYFDETIRGVYHGQPIEIPMTGWSIAKPLGWEDVLDPTTFPNFGVFILTGE